MKKVARERKPRDTEPGKTTELKQVCALSVTSRVTKRETSKVSPGISGKEREYQEQCTYRKEWST